MTADELNQARRYIIHGEGTAPVRWWWPQPPLPAQKLHLIGEMDPGGEPPPPPLALERTSKGNGPKGANYDRKHTGSVMRPQLHGS